MTDPWNIMDIKFGLRSMTQFVLNTITLSQADLGLSRWWVALLVSSVSPQSSVSCICVEQKFIVVGTTPKLNRSAVVFCFLQSSFCIHLVVLPRIWQQAFCFTTVYSRKTGNVFLVSDVEVIESTQGEVGIQWYYYSAHMLSSSESKNMFVAVV